MALVSIGRSSLNAEGSVGAAHDRTGVSTEKRDGVRLVQGKTTAGAILGVLEEHYS